MKQDMKRITGSGKSVYKWGNPAWNEDPVYTGKQSKRPQSAAHKPARSTASAYKKPASRRNVHIMQLIDVAALLVFAAILIATGMNATKREADVTTQNEIRQQLEDNIMARDQELARNTSYDIIASLSADYGFMDDDRLARVDLAPAPVETETASK